MPRTPTTPHVALAGIVMVAALARFWGIGFGLPHTQARPDETFIIDVALSFLRGDFSPPFFDYPWLYMWAVTGLYLVYFLWGLVTGAFQSLADLVASWPRHWEPFFLVSRGLSAASGTLSVLVAYRIGRRLWDETTGLVAAFFLALAFLHVRDAHFGTTDVAMTGLMLLSVAFLLDAHLGSRQGFRAAGLTGGLAVATKYPAVMVVVPMAVSYLIRIIESGGDRARAARDDRLVRMAVPFAIGLAVGVPFVVMDQDAFLRGIGDLRAALLKGPDQTATASPTWLHHATVSLRYGLGLPLLVAGLAGAVGIVVRAWKIGLVLFSLPVAYYVVAASVSYRFFRYAIPFVPFLCLSAAWLVCRVGELVRLKPDSTTADEPGGAVSNVSREPGGRVWSPASAGPRPGDQSWRPASARPGGSVRRTVVIAGLAVALVWPSAASVWSFDRLIARDDNRVVLARWLRDHVPPGSSVLQSGSTYGHAQLDPASKYEQWRWNRTERAFLVNGEAAGGRPDWIVLQESPLPGETQALVKAFLEEDYLLVQRFEAISLRAFHVFDEQDAFFAPFAGFAGATRPGPNFTVFRRASAENR